jgi:hypothetical protein
LSVSSSAHAVSRSCGIEDHLAKGEKFHLQPFRIAAEQMFVRRQSVFERGENRFA